MFGLMNVVFPVMFLLLFILFIAFLVWAIVSNVLQWSKNNASPRLTVEAVVVSRRADTRVHQDPVAGDPTGAHGFHTHHNTFYYATFQVESGDRMELPVTGPEYGMLAEGDRGRLTFQGTRYLGFERER